MLRNFTRRALSLTSYPFPVFRDVVDKTSYVSFFSPVTEKNFIGTVVEFPVVARAVVAPVYVLPGLEEEPEDTESNNSNHTFVDAPGYENALHLTIGKHYMMDPTVIALAEHVKNGWLHLPDNRMFSPYGRVPDPEDIFGTILVKDGKCIADTYQRMPTHRLCSSNGLFVLSEFMHKKLIESTK